MIELKVDEDAEGMRLDKFLRRHLSTVPASHLFKMIRTKKVRVNRKRAQPSQLLKLGDCVAIRGTEERLRTPTDDSRSKAPAPPGRPLEILLEDDWLMAVNKASGVAVHPGTGIPAGTLVDYVRTHLGPKATRNEFAASPAHRLDRETSGIILVAKRRPAMVRLTETFTEGRAKKWYLALVKGRMPKDRGTVDLPLAEHQQTARSKALHGIKMQEARTRYRVLSLTQSCSLLECILDTGRTHQIRRHLVAIGHPIAGDRRYGDFAFNREAKSRWGLKRLFLHSQAIEFPHPAHGKTVRVEAPLPSDLKDVMKRAGLGLSE